MNYISFIPESVIDADVLYFRLENSKMNFTYCPESGAFNFPSTPSKINDLEDELYINVLYDLSGKMMIL